MSTDIPRVRLNTGALIPQIGLGVFRVDPATTQATVEQALALGYRHIDTATGYDNETEIGRAIAASGVPRAELFVTTKLRNDHQKAGDVDGAFGRSLDMLGLDYLDLYLIHWPMPAVGKFVDTWRRFEAFHRDGRAKAIGVSNFKIPHLEQLLAAAEVVPALNQVELHPLFQQRELRAFLDRHDILVEAWAPLGQGRFGLDEFAAITQAAAAHGVTPAQVILRWHLDEGVIAIPKATSAQHQRANLELGFDLTGAELAAIRALDTGRRLAADPDDMN